jgi:dihydroorotate dehydrogenase
MVKLQPVYSLIKPWLFRTDPELIHDQVMNGLEFCSQHPAALRLIELICKLEDQRLHSECFGLRFPNPIGLAAGFDKNARAIPAWLALGFGFVEVGSVTALAQEGNPKPRLFRLPKDEAIINRMGFNNEGAEAIAQRLERLFQSGSKLAAPLGINLGKSKRTPLEDAPEDYRRSLERLWPFGDYFVLNVSSPNTPGLRELQDKDKLGHLLDQLKTFIAQQRQAKPLVLKIAPDLSFAHIDEILELCKAFELSGIIATNTSLARAGLKTKLDEAGGLSGKPLREASLNILRHIRGQTTLPIIAVGGIASATDVLERLNAGASLVQLYTSLVYEGPLLIKRLKQGLLASKSLQSSSQSRQRSR